MALEILLRVLVLCLPVVALIATVFITRHFFRKNEAKSSFPKKFLLHGICLTGLLCGVLADNTLHGAFFLLLYYLVVDRYFSEIFNRAASSEFGCQGKTCSLFFSLLPFRARTDSCLILFTGAVLFLSV